MQTLEMEEKGAKRGNSSKNYLGWQKEAGARVKPKGLLRSAHATPANGLPILPQETAPPASHTTGQPSCLPMPKDNIPFPHARPFPSGGCTTSGVLRDLHSTKISSVLLSKFPLLTLLPSFSTQTQFPLLKHNPLLTLSALSLLLPCLPCGRSSLPVLPLVPCSVAVSSTTKAEPR